MFFDWSDDFSVGVEEIDNEHKLLVQLINELYVAMQENNTSQHIPGIFKAMLDYTRNHFATEKTMMESVAYPDINKHLNEHKALTNKILDMHQRHQKGHLGVSIELLLFLKNWLSNHILETDLCFAKYFVNSAPDTFQPKAENA